MSQLQQQLLNLLIIIYFFINLKHNSQAVKLTKGLLFRSWLNTSQNRLTSWAARALVSSEKWILLLAPVAPSSFSQPKTTWKTNICLFYYFVQHRFLEWQLCHDSMLCFVSVISISSVFSLSLQLIIEIQLLAHYSMILENPITRESYTAKGTMSPISQESYLPRILFNWLSAY